ncbi:unconventional myosin-Va [Schistocerca americana]|uniref:unconventional myosin-Va n=1 Tax=Schistocerca americana TaxID=7009 RepID=UPI001F4F91EA|nr:unconventional myosin-Va [Schistocerca americana]
MNELYSKGAQVWIQHPEKVWEEAEVTEDYKSSVLKVRTEDGRIHDLIIESDEKLPPLRNPRILIGENDLTSLSYLHEPAVLYNLKVRFCQKSSIYTYCGIVLVAINPYDDLPIYGIDTIWAYRGQAMGDLDPHIFAVAEEAYTKLEREQRDQSIIVSGESGAGKTVSAKYAMRYFATVGGSSTETQVEKKVLASSPIMESIGNAKTTRNDNSSRFGKFIEIHFNKQYHIQGASMRTYLLEKSRVVFQAPEERNYHIFYQLCAAREEYPELQLAHQDDFHYLNQGSSPHIQGIDDRAMLEETTNALNLLGFSSKEQMDMFRILAAILHLGNVQIVEAAAENDQNADGEGSAIPADDQHLAILANLLQINAMDMRSWLCHRKIVSLRDVIFKPMTVIEAVSARDALAKHIYAELFNWIVSVVNKALYSSGTTQKFIGVLDIYGFETFEINSFEQFCINYANEKLQQQFNQHVFKLEQEEYMREEIEWKFIDFYDNQPCIDLIETKLGILDLLDEECRMPKGTDASWTEKLYNKCSSFNHFAKPRFGNLAFIIHHFADNVTYQSHGFLEKNKDTVLEDQISVIKNGQNKLIRKLFREEDNRKLTVPAAKIKVAAARPSSTMPASSKQHKKTVGSQFRDSLNMLMSTLNATTPHYVRCIKPNDNKVPFEYNPVRAVQQLRACGVLETIRISAAGFPSRWTYGDFFNRYRVLCLYKDIQRDNLRLTCERIVSKIIKDTDKFQFGKTKIFFRAGQVAYLEKLRADKLRKCCIIIQKQVRAFICRKKYLRVKKSILLLQRYGRGVLARRKAHFLRQTRAAVTIQRYTRGWLIRTKYKSLKACVLGLQARARGLLARRRYQQMRYNHAAIIIQRYVRGWLARKWYARKRTQVILVQSAIRRFLARRKFRKLRQEARSVEHVKKLNKGLENKIISLQQKIGELVKENNALKLAQTELLELKPKFDALRVVETEKKQMVALLTKKDEDLETLKKSLENERDEKMDLINEKERSEKERAEEVERINKENLRLKSELDELNERIKSNQIGAEENLRARVEQEKLMLIREHDQDRDAYQKLLAEYNLLEQRNESLENELSRLQWSGSSKSNHQRSFSDASTVSAQDTTASDVSELGEDIEGVQLVLKLQQKVKELEKERNKLQKQVEEFLDKQDKPRDDEAFSHDRFRLQQLEVEYSRLRANLAKMQIAVAEGSGQEEFLREYNELQLDFDRQREENIQLHSVLAKQTQGLKNVASNNYGSHVDLINEDGELVMAFEAQKKINRQLEDELQQEKNRWQVEREELQQENEKLREENDNQRKLLSMSLTKSPQTQTEAFMQHEIRRLTSENLDLQEKLDLAKEELRQCKKNLKLQTKALKDAGLLPNELDNSTETAESATEKTLVKSQDQRNNIRVTRKKESHYQGMFEFRKEDVQHIVRHLIFELKPRIAVTLLPGLPAYILFMCIRHTDCTNDDEKVRSLLTATINTIKKVTKKRHDDMDTTVLWLSNTLRLLHNLKQYSGDKTFQTENTPRQNEQCLRNFDLSEYRQVLSDIAVGIYQSLIGHIQEKVQPLVVPAILEHEAISGLSSQKPSGMRGRAASTSRDSEPFLDAQKSLDALLQELNSIHKIMGYHGVDPELIVQIFRQMFYFICASSLNNLLLRKDLCHWTKGMQIRYNLSHLEQWCRDTRLQDTNVPDTLQPIIQAAHLLQARKLDEDVQSVCDMCDKLSMFQIIKILNLYTTIDEFEERVPVSFIRKIQAKLQERNEPQEQATLLMDTKFTFPVRFPFNPSNIRLEDIEVPEVLNLPMLKKA